MPDPVEGPGLSQVRVDKWLWAARLFKTRSLATAACNAGHVKIDGESVKPSKLLRTGESIDVRTPGGPRVVEVVKLFDKRVAPAVAQTFYIDNTPPEPEEERLVRLAGMARRDRGAGRPDKRDRRALRKLRGR